MTFHASPGSLTRDADGVRLAAGTPAAVLAHATGFGHDVLEPVGLPTLAERDLRTPGGPAHERAWTWALPGGHQLRWSIGLLADGSGCTVGIAFRNGGAEAVRLRELLLLRSADDGIAVAGDPAGWLLTTLAQSWRVGTLAQRLPSANDDERRIWAGFNQPVPTVLPTDERAADGRWRLFTDFATLVGPQRAGLAFGAMGRPEATVRFGFRVEDGRVRVDAASEMTDVEVPPGAWRQGQEIAILAGDSQEAVRRLLAWCATTHGARTTRPPAVGWCSWYHHGPGVAASDVLAIADFVRETDLVMPVIQVDDGFQRQVGDWACNARFPDGWAPVIERIRAVGSTPGVWLAPLAVHESTALFRDHQDWLQRDAGGDLAGEAGNWGPRSRWIDPTHPAAAAWIQELLRDHRALGFTYFKIDFNTVPGVSTVATRAPRLHDRSLTAFQALRALYARYREAIGEESYLLACIGLNRAVVGYADAARIGPDSAAWWEAEHPCCIRDCIASVGQNAPANGVLFASDPDVSYTLPRGDLDQHRLRTWHGFVGLLGGLALISEPLWMGGQEAGTAEFRLDDAGLAIAIDVIDPDVRLAEPIWDGSSIDLYADVGGAMRQWWFQPALETGGVRAWRAGSPGPVPAPELTGTSARTARGYRLEVSVPWGELGTTADHLRCEVKAAVAKPAGGRENYTAWGTAAPWNGTAGYGTVGRGRPERRTLSVFGWRGSERAFALLTPPAPEKGVSLDPRDPLHRRFGFTARRAWGDFAVMQVRNAANASATPACDTGDLLPGPCHAWSFWDGSYLGVHAGPLPLAELPAHAAHLLRLTPVVPGLPQVVGSDLHIACGAAEIADVSAATDACEIDLHPGAGAIDGSMWLAQAEGLHLVIAEGCRATAEDAGSGVVRIRITERSAATQRIRLARR